MTGKLFFIGVGLDNLQSLSLRAYQILKECDLVLLDAYTNFFNCDVPPELANVDITLVSRHELEDNSHQILEKAKTSKVAILVPGDPFLATTHVTIRMEAVKQGIPHEIIHNASIFSAAPSITGLSAYRFGKVATIPFPENQSSYPYDICSQNLRIEAHTLFLLDIDVKNNRFLDVIEGLKQLVSMEEQKNEGVITPDAIFIGLCKVGSPKAVVKAGTINSFLEKPDFWKKQGAPQALVRCANTLHFAEKDALKILLRFDEE